LHNKYNGYAAGYFLCEVKIFFFKIFDIFLICDFIFITKLRDCMFQPTVLYLGWKSGGCSFPNLRHQQIPQLQLPELRTPGLQVCFFTIIILLLKYVENGITIGHHTWLNFGSFLLRVK
jgi:hypothetical protein